MAVDVTVGVNSFCSMEDASNYFDTVLDSEAWDTATEEKRKKALISATRDLDLFDYEGKKFDSSQALSFPRSGLFINRIAIDSSVTHENVKRACCEYALYLLSDQEDDISEISQIELGNTSITFKGQRQNNLPKKVENYLAPFLSNPFCMRAIKV